MTWPMKHGRERTSQWRVGSPVTTIKQVSSSREICEKARWWQMHFGKTCKNKGKLYGFLYPLLTCPPILSVNQDAKVISQTRSACLATCHSRQNFHKYIFFQKGRISWSEGKQKTSRTTIALFKPGHTSAGQRGTTPNYSQTKDINENFPGKLGYVITLGIRKEL